MTELVPIKDREDMYLKEYVTLGIVTTLFVVTLPVWLPFAIIGLVSHRIAERLIERAIAAERRGEL